VIKLTSEKYTRHSMFEYNIIIQSSDIFGFYRYASPKDVPRYKIQTLNKFRNIIVLHFTMDKYLDIHIHIYILN